METGESGINAGKFRGLLCVSPSMPHVPVQDKLCRPCAGMLQNAGQDLMKADSPLSTGQMMKSPTVSAYKCSFSAYRPAMQKRKRDKEHPDGANRKGTSPCAGNRGKSIEGRQLHPILLLWEPENCGTVYRAM